MSTEATKSYPIDATGKTWKSISAWCNDRMQEHRETLETPGLSERDSDQIRGAIDELKALQRLVEPGPEMGTGPSKELEEATAGLY